MATVTPHPPISTLSDSEPLVAKRRLSESWRDAVARRGAALGIADQVLAAFDARLRESRTPFEAAYLALQAHGALERVDAPRDPARLAAEAERTDAPGIGS